MKLRKYQQETVDYVEASVMFGSTKVCVEAPTGSGKSLMISEIVRKYKGEKIMILVNVSKLIGQISNHLDVLGIPHSILKSGMEDKFDEEAEIQLVMEQTFDARKDKLDLAADIIVRDEHHIGFTGKRFNEIVEHTKPRLVCGFSATPYDSFGVALEGYETFSKVDIKRLIKEGYLMPADTIIPAFGQAISLKGIGKSGDYSESELDNLLNNPEYNQEVVKAYKEHRSGYKAIVFVSGIEHAEDLYNMFKKYGVGASAYHSKMTQKDRDYIMNEFQLGTIDVLISVSTLTTGFDMPECNVMMNCRPTKVHSLKVQMEGRVLRPNGDPLARATIIDCCRATTMHGFYDDVYEPAKDREEAKKKLALLERPIIDYIFNKNKGRWILAEPIKCAQAEVEVMHSTTKEALAYRFEQSKTARDMVELGIRLHSKIWGSRHTNSLDFILKTVGPAVARDGLTVYKTRMRNIIKEGKKPASLHYFPDWYQKNRGW